MSRSRPTIALVLAGLAVVAVGCGGGDESSDTAAPTTSSTAPTTTAQVTTTTVPEPTMPLTGEPVSDVLVSLRRALVAKIDNHPSARPQHGLNQADIVFEENVEQLTRFAAVFHSQTPEVVGPVRSGRTQDIGLLSSLDQPLLVWSGGNGAVTAAVNASTLVNRSALVAPGYFRSTENPAPHNLYARTEEVWATAPEELATPPSQFDYLDADDSPTGSATGGVKVRMDGVRVLWTWDPATSTFLRAQDDAPHVDSDGTQIGAENVVIAVVDYLPSPADANSPEAQTTGSGEVWVFTGGVLRRGIWERVDLMQPWTFTDDEGEPIELSPGTTWMELARAGTVVEVPEGADPATVAYP